MFRRMIETSTKSAWWTILLKLRSIIMRVILMVLIIVMASVIASSVTMWSMKVTTMATATSASIIAIVIIVIATTRRIKLSAVVLKLVSIIILLSPETLYMAFYHYIGPSRVYGLYCYLYSSCCGSSYLHLHIVLPVQGEGKVVEVAVVVLLCLSISFLCDL